MVKYQKNLLGKSVKLVIKKLSLVKAHSLNSTKLLFQSNFNLIKDILHNCEDYLKVHADRRNLSIGSGVRGSAHYRPANDQLYDLFSM
jgi:hypothetical protein